ncbi:PucR family transcriptional regulator [Cohnella soli]|uniref:PucR family transcriptional regulator n=1 Tax=Cohnella soli TaxID=425005 RepID=A0ABW0HVS2_9BACL
MAKMSRKGKRSSAQTPNVQFTVKDMLDMPQLKGARILTGDVGVSRPITAFTVVDRDGANLTRPEEFLMVLDGLYRDEPERLRLLVPELARKGVAGIGIRTGEGSEDVPQEIVDEAVRQGLPLLALPDDCDFSEFAVTVMENMLAIETTQVSELQRRIQSLSRLLLEGKGIGGMLDALEEILGNPVAIVRDNDTPWLSASLKVKDSTGLLPLLQLLPYRQVSRGAESGFALLQGEFRAYLREIPLGRGKQACFVILERRRGIRAIDALTVDRMAALAGVELANAEAVKEVEDKYLDQFLQDWLTGKIVTDRDWKLRAEVCGCVVPEGIPMCALIVGMQRRDPVRTLKDTARRLRSELIRTSEGVLVAPVGDDLAIILPVGKQARDGDGRTVDAVASKLLEELRSLFGDKGLRLYVGKMFERAEDLPSSWSQAVRARQVAEVCGLPGDIVRYDRLGVYSLLYLIPPGDEREQFLNRYAIPLQLADRKGGGRLVETLDMFFRCNGNIRLTSEKLYAHYNTIVYRLEKVQSIVGVSLDDPEERLQLHLALKLVQMTPLPMV